MSGRVFASFLFGVAPLDPMTYAVVTIVLSFVALGATDWPARRAASVDPVVAVRSE